MTFSEEAFLAQKPGSPLQTFHKRAVHLQLFKQVSAGPGRGRLERGLEAGPRGRGKDGQLLPEGGA